jgi:murein L,D-transpeptidase YcbB/YkuD
VGKARLEQTWAEGGWGRTVPAGTLRPGDRGDAVIALRNRLIRMGYLRRTTAAGYDDRLAQAVRRFQAMHGLAQDGIAGPGTLQEINQSVPARLRAIHVALERERWNNADPGARHIQVNLADFTAKIIDDGKVTFETRSVVGARNPDRQSPEFSDVMEFMIVNPSWYVPHSIATKEYLPELQEDPFAVDHIELTDEQGQKVDRGAIDFSQFNEESFPFSMREPPSRSNALGLVKFMFPNPHNIYLHDTPAKKLFAREVRAFSHGCIRLADPFDFAYALLAVQTDDPQGDFARALATGEETRIDLVQKVPVHLIYRTAVATDTGEIGFRRDIYGRDALIWEALRNAGVELDGVQG